LLRASALSDPRFLFRVTGPRHNAALLVAAYGARACVEPRRSRQSMGSWAHCSSRHALTCIPILSLCYSERLTRFTLSLPSRLNRPALLRASSEQTLHCLAIPKRERPHALRHRARMCARFGRRDSAQHLAGGCADRYRHLQTSAHPSDLASATDVAQRRCSTRILVLQHLAVERDDSEFDIARRRDEGIGAPGRE
jgi:hypothetical protein